VILTTEEAAAELHIDAATVRKMVERGEVTPLRKGARPLLFRAEDIIEAGQRRLTKAQHDRLDTLAQALACAESDDLSR